jgi:alcohol dehydrogenase
VASLEAAGMCVAVFDEVRENPTSVDVAACVGAATQHQADSLIGLGGGSSMDTAKGCNFIYTNGGDMRDYWGKEKATQPMLPLVAIPTTAGTGSECQRYALISDPETHQKMACGDVKALARLAILDPQLTLTQPRFVTACTGMDALSHAVEAAVTKPAIAQSQQFAFEAFGLLYHNLPKVLGDPHDLEARSAAQVGAALGGAAIELSMLGGAHSAANPLTAHFDVVHGQAVGLLLPEIIRFNSQDAAIASRYYRMMLQAGAAVPGEDPRAVSVRLADGVRELLEATGLNRSLQAFGVTSADLPMLSREAEGQWTAQFNPRPLCAADFEGMYARVLA